MNQIDLESTEVSASRPKIVEPVRYLRQISGMDDLVLGPTDSKTNIARSAGVFKAWLDPDFKAWGCDVESEPTGPQILQVHEQVKYGRFEQIYCGIDTAQDALCLSQGQIVQYFVRKMHEKYLIHENPDDAGYGYFRFLFKAGAEFFVASVDVHSDGALGAHIHGPSHVPVWGAAYRNRFVLPQLAAQAV